jgi:hypothetical protein
MSPLFPLWSSKPKAWQVFGFDDAREERSSSLADDFHGYFNPGIRVATPGATI